MIKIDVTDYRKLAFKHINALPFDKKRGQEEGDLLNAAYIGIHLASLAYNPEKDEASFVTFCYWYIQRELSALNFKQTTVEGKRVNTKKEIVPLIDDLCSIGIEEHEGLVQEDTAVDTIFAEEFLESLFKRKNYLTEDMKVFLSDMCNLDEHTAVLNYQKLRGCSRMAASHIKKQALLKAKEHYVSLN